MIPKISNHGGHALETCDHAKGKREEIIARYESEGFLQYAITEHFPPNNDQFLYPDEVALNHDAAFLTERFRKYWQDDVPKLRKRFPRAFFGFETEFYGPDPEQRMENAIAEYGPEIVVASVHHVRNIPIDFDQAEYSRALQACGGIENLHSAYYDNQFQLIKTVSKYTSRIGVVLGHMDLIRLFSCPDVRSSEVRDRITRNIETAAKGGIVFELNGRAFKKALAEPYPESWILELIAKSGGQITFGDDSHDTSDVGNYFEKLCIIARNYFSEIVCFSRGATGIAKTTIPL